MAESLTLRNNLGIAVPSPLLLTLLFCLPQLNETLILPALPAIMLEMQSAPQIAVGIYFLGLMVGIAFWGVMSEHIGRRPAILAGILLYLCMSFACANASSLTYLFIAHFFQALGASVGWVVTQAITVDTLTTYDRQKLIYQMNLGTSFIPAIGLTLGGYLTAKFSWNANFLCLTFIGIALLMFAGCFLAETKQDVLDQPQNETATPQHTVKIIMRDKQFFINTCILGLFYGFYYIYLMHAAFVFSYIKLAIGGLLLSFIFCIVAIIANRTQLIPVARYQYHLNIVNGAFTFMYTFWIAVCLLVFTS